MVAADQLACEKHCVARCGSSWFAFPASAVREVAVRPTIVKVPRSDSVLAGLCHLRNEFIPVLSAADLLEVRDSSTTEGHMLVLTGVDGPWALLIDAVAALDILEISFVREWESTDARSSSMVGTASFQDHVVQVLDPELLYRFIMKRLETTWIEQTGDAVHHQNELLNSHSS